MASDHTLLKLRAHWQGTHLTYIALSAVMPKHLDNKIFYRKQTLTIQFMLQLGYVLIS